MTNILILLFSKINLTNLIDIILAILQASADWSEIPNVTLNLNNE